MKEKIFQGTSLEVQWLTLCLPLQGRGVGGVGSNSGPGVKIPCASWSNTKCSNRSDTVTSPIKTKKRHKRHKSTLKQKKRYSTRILKVSFKWANYIRKDYTHLRVISQKYALRKNTLFSWCYLHYHTFQNIKGLLIFSTCNCLKVVPYHSETKSNIIEIWRRNTNQCIYCYANQEYIFSEEF